MAGRRTSRLKLLFNTKYGQILVSCLLGLGLATVFRRACKASSNCVVYRVPTREKIQTQVYKERDQCFKVALEESKCDTSKKEFLLE